NRNLFNTSTEEMPVFGTIASRFNDDGVTALYQSMIRALQDKGLKLQPGKLPATSVKNSTGATVIVPPKRVRYLAEIAEALRSYHQHTEAQSKIARERQALRTSKALFQQSGKGVESFDELIADKDSQLDSDSKDLL